MAKFDAHRPDNDQRRAIRALAPVAALLALILLPALPASADQIEFLSGAKVQGKLVEIKKEEKQVVFEAVISNSPVVRTYSYGQIHAVTIGDKRYVINEKSDSPTPRTGGSSASSPSTSSGAGDGGDGGDAASGDERRSKAEVERLINELGKTPPDWYENAALVYPDTLDLAWPKKPPGGWDNQRNVGQFVWDVINPNPGKWQEGVRFMHHLLTVNRGDPEVRLRIMNELGRMYHDLLEDYPRAAFWWRQAGVDKERQFNRSAVHLAECYWRLGNKQMAAELLAKTPRRYETIKLWADLGEIDKARQTGDVLLRAGGTADEVYLRLADGYRTAGQFRPALDNYKKVLAVPAADPGKGRIERNHRRARASTEAIELFELLDLARVPDGRYEAESLGYEGQVRVAVTVRAGRIESVRVTDHREKQFYSALTDTPTKIIKKQGVKGVDATSSATITSEAIINATAKALAEATR